ncbi:hypothetical protein SAMN05216202_3660 [Pseudomonas mucidolens]|uniref:Uncharacterized protein n=1 Tax=Pseudomonas mucidolens TaxID=46679 RepID=A0A1H2NHV5_9PSED|nr:hypothetical protein SAMN05216202_3660 [Pseudomonas mucidolens]SQH31999.1 Uncharacterised protein [Pseudomonas mucidolens]
MLAKNVNDNAFILDKRGAFEFFASKLAPTGLNRSASGCEAGFLYVAQDFRVSGCAANLTPDSPCSISARIFP